MSDEMLRKLLATGPHPDHTDELMLYGRLVGSWQVQATWYAGGEVGGTAQGEWHFAWILGGRGIQDVLFRAGAPAEQWGTTLRCYDPSEGVWHISWMQPSSGEFVAMIGRRAGDEIVQESTVAGDPRRRVRWTFTELTHESFRWLGEVSLDEGATWSLEQEMCASRTATPGAGA